ncbi:hypothetical protein ABZU32_09425 [Sphaerisporangium sp. NPDC005288]|uniref:hypothetical protein n=1 Tax=Sphaerisporangium sp. NPDC005288 TaxID=3155114 RepID=UPI0033B145C5
MTTFYDPKPWGLRLPENWHITHMDNGKPYQITGFYDVLGWAVRIHYNPPAPWDGPSGIDIDFRGDEEEIESAIESDGITVDVLRSIPLGEARRVIADIAKQLREKEGIPELPQLPRRLETPHHYAVVAQAYIQAVEAGRKNPILYLSDLWGISKNTMAARIKKAREMGLLTGEEGKTADRLTDKAREILNGVNPDEPPY